MNALSDPPAYLRLLALLSLVLMLVGCRVDAASSPPAPHPTAMASATPLLTVQVVLPLQRVTPTPDNRPRPTPTVSSGIVRIDAGDNFYYPPEITVKVSSKIRWTHVGQTAHDVHALDRSWGVAIIPIGGYWEYSFSRPGVYDYYCIIHAPGMVGRLIVVE
jgi:plastocyanin